MSLRLGYIRGPVGLFYRQALILSQMRMQAHPMANQEKFLPPTIEGLSPLVDALCFSSVSHWLAYPRDLIFRSRW